MSRQVERGVIGALLLEPESIDEIRLEPEMFEDPLLGRMYLEFLRGYENHYTVDAVVLAAKIQDFPTNTVQEVIRDCFENTLTSAQIGAYAEIVRDEYRAAQFGKILGQVKPDPEKLDEQIGRTIGDLEALLNTQECRSKSLPEIVREQQGNYFRDTEAGKIYLGFPQLDDILGGLEGGDVIVIGARPGVGKSAFVTQIAGNLAKGGKRIGFYNLEMQEKQVYERFVVAESGIGLTRLRRAVRFIGDEQARFDRANAALEKQEQIVITTGSKAASEIRAESRHMQYDVIIIDYLQLLRADQSYRGNRYAEVGAVSRAIKALAMELNIPIIALSQLNRASEAKADHEPTMAELREAGDIEQDASVIMLMWNADANDRSRKGLNVAKQRQGRTGKIFLQFDGDKMRFTECGEKPGEWSRAEETPFG